MAERTFGPLDEILNAAVVQLGRRRNLFFETELFEEIRTAAARLISAGMPTGDLSDLDECKEGNENNEDDEGNEGNEGKESDECDEGWNFPTAAAASAECGGYACGVDAPTDLETSCGADS
ncbi:MAG: hypothetical protein ABJH07_26790 [Sedimentitalea sp.]|uniref:hypothetical protein n=1 Tax=Sedimentitalea sp. TaxID=2048915 RepID=UPI0032648501